tara:strand:- start:283 stop:615 length:333 start_codon:yes stop_codon:yes gene_type:complete
MTLIHWLSYFSGISFLGFGLGCFLSERMVLEFKRYKLSRYRTTTGFFQIIGAVGLLCSSLNFTIWSISSLGISVLMLLGFMVRLKIKDRFIQTLPSLFYMILNGYIFCSI